jgi:putative SOS response-associated peptidase YedK
MSDTLRSVRGLVRRREVRISSHGYDELAADGILATDVIAGVENAEVVEDYPDYPKGPCVLVLQRDGDDQPVHVVWGIPPCLLSGSSDHCLSTGC